MFEEGPCGGPCDESLPASPQQLHASCQLCVSPASITRELPTTTHTHCTHKQPRKPRTANRYYMEAMKQGTGESLLALVGSGREGSESVLQTLGSVDERQDGAPPALG